ncbi:helix-turn-helix domain-containing protein [Microbacterium arborescens]
MERLYTPAEAAEIVRQHVVTIRLRLEGGELHGTQRKKGGRWLIAEACLRAYASAEPCEHQSAERRAGVQSIGRRRAA